MKTYDPKAVKVTFGTITVSGYAEDSQVEVDYDEDAYKLQMGVDGEGTRVKTNNNAAKVTITLMQSSATNDLFSALALADRSSGGGVEPLMVKDNSGRSLHMASQAWIMKPPTAGYHGKASERKWVIQTDNMVSTYGGN